MIKIVDVNKFKTICNSYKIWGNDNIVIAKLYPNGFRNAYWEDLKECFDSFILNIIGVISFPIRLIKLLIKFIPIIIIKEIEPRDTRLYMVGDEYI